ncbi:MAG TPA: anti-sigma factor, partial [Bacteroidia bacterium]|nr:anti-sigma factor [Bacteroidia bacterium]
ETYAEKHAATPPPYIKEQVMSRIKTNDSADKGKIIPIPSATRSESTSSGFLKYAVAAACVLLVASAALNYVFYQKWKSSETELTQLSTEKKQLADQFQTQKASYQMALKDLEILKNPSVVKMEMKGLTPAPDARAYVLKDMKTNEIFLDIKKLPAPPDSMQYQFWAIVQGKPVDAGMISLCPPTDSCNIHKMNTIPDAQAFAISLEKKGGNTQPKGQLYMAYGI